MSSGAIKAYKNCDPYVKDLHSIVLRPYVYFTGFLSVLAVGCTCPSQHTPSLTSYSYSAMG